MSCKDRQKIKVIIYILIVLFVLYEVVSCSSLLIYLYFSIDEHLPPEKQAESSFTEFAEELRPVFAMIAKTNLTRGIN